MPFFKGIIASDSMYPLIKTGDKIYVEVGQKNIERFDVIVFLNDGLLTCHYMWSMNRLVSPILIRTRSLKYGHRDDPFLFDDYLGKVVSHRFSKWQKLKLMLKFIFRNTRI